MLPSERYFPVAIVLHWIIAAVAEVAAVVRG
jgi:cytochrome b561